MTEPRDAADDGFLVVQVTRLRHHHLFHHRFRDAHGVDRVGRLVGRQANHALHAVLDRGLEQVVGADYVGLDGFHRVEFAGRHLLQRGSVKDVVDATGGIENAREVTHVADIKLQLRIVVFFPHIILLLFVAAENADFRNLGVKESLENRVAERTRPAGDQ